MMRFLPLFISNRIKNRPTLQKIIANTSWLFFGKIFRLGINLLVGVLLARYLGPEQFGMLNYSIAFVALFGVIATMGLNEIVVRDLVIKPEDANTLLGTTFLLQFFAGILAFLVAIVAINFIRPNDESVKLMVAILGFVLVFKSADVIRYWFESRVTSKYVVWVENSVLLLIASVKIYLIVDNAPLMNFVWAAFAEGFLIGLCLLLIYVSRGGILSNWKPKYNQAIMLLKNSWPLILSGLAIMIYMRIDQIMLGQMVGDEFVGIYTVAVNVSEAFYFIPIAIVASVFPAIIEAKKANRTLYYQQLQRLYDLMTLIALMVVIPMTFFSDELISLLFGQSYFDAGNILAIHIWAGIFVFLGVASGKWLVVEELQKYVLYRTAFGAIVNIVLNLVLIPKYGMQGAAIATVISQFVSVFSIFVIQRTRISGFMMINSFYIYKSARRIINA